MIWCQIQIAPPVDLVHSIFFFWLSFSSLLRIEWQVPNFSRLINEFESDLCSDEYKLNSSEIKASLSIVHYYNNFLNHIHSLIHNSLQTLLVMTDSPPSFPSENYVNPPPPLKSSSLAQVLNNDWSIKMALDSCVDIFINWKW